MPYCTKADLIERFGESELLAIARDESGMAIDTAVVERACEDASGEIDGYVSAAGYPVPLSPVPRIVIANACDIARYRLYDEHATDQVQKRYDDAVKFLRSVSPPSLHAVRLCAFQYPHPVEYWHWITTLSPSV